MIGGPNLRHVRIEPLLARCTSSTTTAVTQLNISVILGCACSEWPPGLWTFNAYSIFLSSVPPDVPDRVQRAISP